MKKMIFLAAILVVFATTNTFAQTKTPSAVVEAFEHSFAKAENPSWTVVNSLYRVNFSLKNESLTAYFNADGELIASSRTIALMQLPISLQSSLEKYYSNYTVSSLFEVDENDGIHYYAKVNGQKSERLLKSTSFGDCVTN